MNNFWSLVGFEYKKLFKIKMNMIFLSIALVISVVSVLLNNISDLKTIELHKEIVQQNVGYVDEVLFNKTMTFAQEALGNKNNYYFNNNGKEVLTPEARIEFIFPYYNIYDFLNYLYKDKVETVGIEKPIQLINANNINGFYNQYKSMLIENVVMNDNFSDVEKQKHIKMISRINTPFYNDYSIGWTSIRNLLPLIGLLVLTMLTMVSANIFGKEYSSKTDAIILSTKYGKSKLILVKFVVVISFSVIFCSTITLLHILTYLIWYGFSGGNTPLQFLAGYQYATYPITISESMIACILVFIAVSIAFCCFGTMVSAICKNSLTTLTIIFLLIFAPLFLPPADNRVFQQLVNLFPARIFDHQVIFSEYFYTFGDISFSPFTFYLIISLVGCIVLLPLAYRGFKNHQVV